MFKGTLTLRGAEWLRSERRAAGLTQHELAEYSGVGEITIRRIEAGRHAETRTFIRLAQALVAYRWLYAKPEPALHTLERRVDALEARTLVMSQATNGVGDYQPAI